MSELFGPSKDHWTHNAVYGYGIEDDMFLAMGFQSAGNLLIKAVIDGAAPDGLYVPIAFTFRHGLELALKDAIQRAAMLAEKPAPRKLTNTHSLKRLGEWLQEFLSETSQGTLPSMVNEVIDKIDDVDPNGQTFRYSEVRDAASGNSRLARPDYGRIDVVDLGRRMSETISVVISFADYIQVCLDGGAEIRNMWY